MARNVISIGGEKQVNFINPDEDNRGLANDQENPEVALLSNGNYIVVYQHQNGGSGGFAVWSAQFTSAGNYVAGSTFRVYDNIDSQFDADVAPRTGGGYAVVLEDREHFDTNSNQLQFTIVLPNNTQTYFSDFIGATDGSSKVHDPSIAAFANGTYIVTYTRDWQTSGDLDALFAIVNSAGTAFTTGGVPTSLAATGSTGSPIEESNVAVATSGNLAAAVYEDEGVGGENSAAIQLKTVNSAGTVVDTETVANVAGDLLNPDVARLSDGRFIIVWHTAGESDILGRIYNPATKAFSGAAFVLSNAIGTQSEAKVVGLPDGGFLLSFTDSSGRLGDGSAAVHARRFDANGIAIGDEFRVNSGTVGAQGDAAIVADSAGRVFAAWTNGGTAFTTDTDPNGVQGQLLQTAVETVNGTAGSDQLATYSLGEPINGLAGDDTIDAKAGNDVVNGGEGKDLLTGGPGLDAFVFDAKLKKFNVDHITDVLPGTDEIRLDQTVFKKLKVGELNEKAFFAEKKADEGHDGNDRIVYDEKSGECFYDKDGEGGKKAKLFAIIEGGPDNVSHEDFVVVA